MKKTATLKNWEFMVRESSDGERKLTFLIGNIYDDEARRFEDGERLQRTSYLLKVDFETGLVETCNTIYKLDPLG